jgi:hypothetical protein
LDLTVKNLVLSYETLANQSVKLNQSYLSLLNVYEELILTPGLFAEMDKVGSSPLKVVDSMRQDKLILEAKFTNLIGLIANAQKHFVRDPEAKELSSIAHDCQVMWQFVKNIELNQLQQMFAQLSV